jgi:hypothetical protein
MNGVPHRNLLTIVVCCINVFLSSCQPGDLRSACPGKWFRPSGFTGARSGFLISFSHLSKMSKGNGYRNRIDDRSGWAHKTDEIFEHELRKTLKIWFTKRTAECMALQSVKESGLYENAG